MALIEMDFASGGGETLNIEDVFKGKIVYSSGTGYKNITKERGTNYTISNNNTIICGMNAYGILVIIDEGASYGSVTGNHQLTITHNGTTTNYNVAANRATSIIVPLVSGDSIKFNRLITTGNTTGTIYIVPEKYWWI